MSDAGSPLREDSRPGVSGKRVARQAPSMFRDPLVRTMAFIASGLVILFLVTVVSVLVTGITTSSGPRTQTERQVAVAGAAVKAGSTDPAQWGEYIAALIGNGQYATARDVISRGRASVDDSGTADFGLAEARLAAAQKDYEGAIAAADKTMKQADKAYQAKIVAGGTTGRSAKAQGLPENYYDAVLIKAYAYRDLRKWDKAIAMFDLYIGKNPSAADILVDRGNAKIDAGDRAGAEKDFRTALTYVPDSQDALAGLTKIGASK